MAWLDAVERWLHGSENATAEAQRTESVSEGMSLAEEDRNWRSISSTGIREPTWAQTQETMLDAAEAYRANPLACRIVDLTADHVLGKGLKLKANDADTQAWLDRWWSHPQNSMATRAYDLCRELSISGEIFVTFHPSPAERMTYVRSLPPINVDEIETDPEDLERELRFHEASTADPGGRWWTADTCAHYAVNRLTGCVRGQSDLTPILPWLRRYKDWLTDRVRINRFKGAYLWWVKLTGADKATVEAKKLQLTQPPSSGSVIVSNETEEWTALQPNISADDVSQDGHAIRLMIAAGAGLPLHFLAEPEGSNRATAAEMGNPTLRHFERRQIAFGGILADVARRAYIAAGYRPAPSLRITCIFEDLTTTDNLKNAQAAAAMVNALAVARDRGWLSDSQAKAVLTTYIGIKQEADNL